ncbi:MAG: hypothetical protein LBQ03_03155 [Puniceicoccales bacterium]|nr:hypothetical protein [Puniceicoccales bacterium]
MDKKLLKSVMSCAIGGFLSSLWATENLDSISESEISAEISPRKDEVFQKKRSSSRFSPRRRNLSRKRSFPENEAPKKDEASQTDEAFQEDEAPQENEENENSENSDPHTIVEELLKEKLAPQFGNDPETMATLMRSFLENIPEILFADVKEKTKLWAINQSILYAIEHNDCHALAQILDNEIGEPIRQEIEKNGIEILEKAQKEINVSVLENRYHIALGHFFNERQILWIEYAIQRGSLEVVALFLVYHWHTAYSDDEDVATTKLNELSNLAFQNNQPEIETLLRNLFCEDLSEDTTISDFRQQLNRYPVYVKEPVKRNVQFALEMASKLGKDSMRLYTI